MSRRFGLPLRSLLGFGCLLHAGLLSGCVNPAQQHDAFKTAEVRPARIQARIGELVRFDVRPPVAKGTTWTLTTYGPVRFAQDRGMSQVEWTAVKEPIHFEAVAAPWDDRGKEPESREWLWYTLTDIGAMVPFEHPLPVQRAEFKEIAPVTFTWSYSLGGRDPQLSFQERRKRIFVTYQTAVQKGTAHAPKARMALVETGGKKVLYAEVWTNYGENRKEDVGYEMVFSYDVAVGMPVEVVVVEWVGHGWTYGPFNLHRIVVEAPPKPEEKPATPPAEAAPPPAEAAPPPAAATTTPAAPSATAPTAVRPSAPAAPSATAPAAPSSAPAAPSATAPAAPTKTK